MKIGGNPCLCSRDPEKLKIIKLWKAIDHYKNKALHVKLIELCWVFVIYLFVAVCHPTVIIKLIAISTGIKSAIMSRLQNMERRIPFPAPARRPVGPFKLSTQPGIGSFQAATTINK